EVDLQVDAVGRIGVIAMELETMVVEDLNDLISSVHEQLLLRQRPHIPSCNSRHEGGGCGALRYQPYDQFLWTVDPRSKRKRLRHQPLWPCLYFAGIQPTFRIDPNQRASDGESIHDP